MILFLASFHKQYLCYLTYIFHLHWTSAFILNNLVWTTVSTCEMETFYPLGCRLSRMLLTSYVTQRLEATLKTMWASSPWQSKQQSTSVYWGLRWDKTYDNTSVVIRSAATVRCWPRWLRIRGGYCRSCMLCSHVETLASAPVSGWRMWVGFLSYNNCYLGLIAGHTIYK